MAGFSNPFARGDDGDLFDTYDAFVPANVPEPGPFLSDQSVLTGDAHLAFHRLTRDVFEQRGVYDMTFNYNLARLNLDTRHPDAGYRYAEETGASLDGSDDLSVLRAEFTPTTPFCPQCHTLAIGSFRAWNGLADRHEYDLVRVRAHPMHHESESINAELAALEAAFLETGDASVSVDDGGGDDHQQSVDASPTSRPRDVDAPF